MEITPTIHLLMIGFVVIVSCINIYFGSKASNRKRYDIYLGYSLMIFWLLYNVYYFMPENFDFGVSLPLHACDLIGVCAAFAIINSNKIFRSVLYFSGFALATQAFITPTGNQDPSTVRFWLFWGLHAGIIASAIYDLVIRKYKPTLKDLILTIKIDCLYIGILLPVNYIFSWNYGYIGDSKPDVTTVVDFLGNWPLRVLWIFLLVIFLQTMMLAIFYICSGTIKLFAKNNALKG